ncbi:MAG: hypothetical protein AB1758_27135 [Candidatus Eremiobacterota bacterium]
MSLEMAPAYRMAARAVRQRYAEQHPELLEGLAELAGRGAAVFTGSYDQAEILLQTLGVSVTLDPATKVSAPLVVVNCSGSYPDALVKSAPGWVEKGKTLITSDWALHYVIEQAFPGTLKWTGTRSSEETIGVEPELDSVWSEVVVLGADPQWWLWGSYGVEVVDPGRVRVEARSHDSLVRYGSPIVAARFPHGAGTVFHAIGHFWAKKSGTPTATHDGPAEDFLRRGMRLSEDGVGKVLRDGGEEVAQVNFARLQSAVTATELVAQLGVRSLRTG